MESGYILDEKRIRRPVEKVEIEIHDYAYNLVTLKGTKVIDLDDALHMCRTLEELGFKVGYGVEGNNVDISILKED